MLQNIVMPISSHLLTLIITGIIDVGAASKLGICWNIIAFLGENHKHPHSLSTCVFRAIRPAIVTCCELDTVQMNIT